MADPIIDRTFAEKFLQAADRPMDYGVYLLFHDWWAEAPEEAIDGYLQGVRELPGAKAFLAKRFLAQPLRIEELAPCAPGTLGREFHDFVVENNLLESLARDYHAFNAQLQASGALKRLPEDLSYMMLRGFQTHDMLHVLTGYDSSPLGELKLAAFYLAQMQFPYHAMRMAVTMAHTAFVKPEFIVPAMDAIAEGWTAGRKTPNLNFIEWEDELNTSLSDLRRRYGLMQMLEAA